MPFSRREFLKISTTGLAGLVFSGIAGLTEGEAEELGVEWHKAPCRFCGTGCGVLVGTKNGKVVAVRGDPEAGVNRGLLCIKGYSLPKILYAKDRLTKPLTRKEGKFVPISWEEALDLVSAKFKQAIKKYGSDSVAMYGSGQWTVFEGYAALKLMKAGIGTNNLECNARLCMASAVTGFMTTFGMDEPMGCYDDIEYADTFFLWGANMAEMHPVLFSRILEQKRKFPQVKLVDLTTMSTRSSEFADLKVVFKPQSDLALINAMGNLIIQEGLVEEEFVKNFVMFKKGKENIGYGLEDKFKFTDEAQVVNFEDYKNFLSKYTPEYSAEISGVPAEKIRELAHLFADRRRKTVSFWTMGFNQHTRGTWVNNLVYNLHLLTGEISQPGNSPFSLTGQPSACGTTREVGTFTHRLPADMLVTNPEHRKIAAEIWKVPVEKIPAQPTYSAVEMFRALDRGEIKVIWVQVSNPFQTLPNVGRYRKTAERRDSFIIVSDVYPTRTTELADLILPSAFWVEKEGMFGNSERRTQHWFKLVDPPGEAKPDLWQTVEVAKRLGYSALFTYPEEKLEKALFEEYRQFRAGKGKDLAPYEVYTKVHGGLRWPVVNGKETLWRYREGYDPYVKSGEKVKFYGNKKDENRAVIWLRPYEPPAELPDKEYPFWLCTGRVLEHWHSGTITRRVPELHRAVPEATAQFNPEDAQSLGIKNGEQVKIISRRGSILAKAEIEGRTTPQKGMVYVPFFDENILVNLVTLDAYCPISNQPDYKKCAVRIEKI